MLLSRDARGGVLVNESMSFRSQATVPRVRARNTVGAGDALLAAAAAEMAQGAPPADWLRSGLATATAGVQRPAGELAKCSSVTAMRQRIKLHGI